MEEKLTTKIKKAYAKVENTIHDNELEFGKDDFACIDYVDFGSCLTTIRNGIDILKVIIDKMVDLKLVKETINVSEYNFKRKLQAHRFRLLNYEYASIKRLLV